MIDIAKRFKYCPYCGKEFRGGCTCPYGSHVKMRMDFDDRLRQLYVKRFCPLCGHRSTSRVCGHCDRAFDQDDMFY